MHSMLATEVAYWPPRGAAGLTVQGRRGPVRLCFPSRSITLSSLPARYTCYSREARLRKSGPSFLPSAPSCLWPQYLAQPVGLERSRLASCWSTSSHCLRSSPWLSAQRGIGRYA